MSVRESDRERESMRAGEDEYTQHKTMRAQLMDPSLPVLLPSILKRVGMSDQFLREAAEYALRALACYCSTSKCMPVLVRCAMEKGKGVVMRAASASAMELIISTENRVCAPSAPPNTHTHPKTFLPPLQSVH